MFPVSTWKSKRVKCDRGSYLGIIKTWQGDGALEEEKARFRRLPTAWERETRTAVGEVKGPNVITGYEDGAMNFIVDSFLRSICQRINTEDC